MRKIIIKFLQISLLGIFFILVTIFVCNFLVERKGFDKTYTDVNKIPKNKVGLVLGTSKYLINGRVNLYYKYRINAAVTLYKSRKINYIIVSGDNGTKNYNEPSNFKQDLIKRGVPEDKIYLDYAGFRTLDSVIRVKKIFGQSSVTIISQEFHNERAIYLANYFGVNAVGFNAKNVPDKYGLKVELREYLARVKVFVDIALNVKPKFLGKQIKIK